MTTISNNNENTVNEIIVNEPEPDKLCYICYTTYDDTTKYNLKCNHSFHYKCLLNSIKATNTKYCNNQYNKQCPYCRTTIDNINLKPGYSYIKGIHKKYVYKKKNICCKAIIKSGINTGKQCKCRVKSQGYCGRHKLFYI